MIKIFGRRRVGRFGAALGFATGLVASGWLLATPVDAQVADEAEQGAWSEVGDWNFIPIHASVLDDGRVLTYGGTRTGGQGGFELDVWDPDQGLGSTAHTTVANNQGTNLFCSFSIDDPNQDRTLLLGGEVYNGRSPTFTAAFDGTTLTGFASMNNPRWYPTATTLWDGRVLVQGGVPGSFASRGNPVRVAEVHTPGQGWQNLEGTRNAGVWATPNYGWWYPKSHVTPHGRVWNLAWDQMFYLDPDGGGSVTRLGTFPTRNMGASSASVMFDTGLVLQVGGGERGSDDQRFEGSNNATVVDLNYDPPRIRAAASMNFKRHWADAIVLPDGRVLVVGGSRVNNSNTDVALNPEVWDPATDTWTVLGANVTPRLYHSTTLLLPDGSIYVGGGGAPGPQNNLNAEVFFPPYLYQGDGQIAPRPTITSAPDAITYDQRFTIGVDGPIDRVTLIKSGNNTHGMSSQIFQELTFTRSGGQLQVDSPDFATVATPGRYMLFTLEDGVPSEATIVTLSGSGLTPPQPRQLPPNLLANGGFEAPDLAGDAGFAIVATPNWSSDRADQALELWDAGHQNIGAAEGDQFAELNVSEPTTIGQEVTVVPGAAYRWSFEHRGRQNSDTVEVLINGEVDATITTGPGAWRLQSGTFVAPSGGSTLDFALRAVDPGGAGNLVDDVRLEFVSDPPADEVEASGTVTEDDGGGPVSGVVIDLFSSGRTSWLGSTSTDQAGVYRFSIEPNTCYVLTFTAPSGRSLIGPGTNSGGQYQNRDFCAQDQAVTGLDTQVTAGNGASTAAEGTIVDGTGVGIGGVTVDLFQATADGSRGSYLTSVTTGPSGTYRFDLPAAGCYIHTAISPDDRTFTTTGSRFANIAYCAASGETVVGLDATLTGGTSTIGGQVVEIGGGPAVGVTVDLFTATAGGDRTDFVTVTSTDQDGNHRFAVTPGCYVQVAIAPPGRSFVATGTGFQEGFACVDDGETATSFLATLNAN